MQNLYSLINAISKIAQALPDVHTVVLSNVFELNSNPAIDYSVFAIVQDVHRADDDYYYYSFFLYYIDRLLNDKSNVIQIQSHGINLLSTVISKIEQLGLIVNHDEVQTTFQPFTQRFSDECAGVYARVEIMVPIDCTTNWEILVNPLLADLTTWQPGTYNPADFGADAFKTVTVQGTLPNIWVKKTPTLLVGTQDNPVDYNDLTDSGYYYVNANNSYVVNSPFRGWQPNTVVNVITHIDYDESGTAYNHIVQVATPTYTYTTNNDYTWGSQYYRVCGWNITIGGMVWGDWQEIATTDNVIRKEAIYISWNEGDEDIDFNNFTTSGYYALKYIYNHCVNAPVPSFGDCLLNVVCDHGNFSGDEDIIYQEATFTERNIPPTKYIRTYGKNDGVSGWSDWYQYALTAVNNE